MGFYLTDTAPAMAVQGRPSSVCETTEGKKRISGKFLVKPKTHTPGSPTQGLGLRYDNPNLGRWNSRDPIGRNGGLNLFCFTKNRPVNSVDPFGQFCITYWTSDASPVNLQWGRVEARQTNPGTPDPIVGYRYRCLLFKTKDVIHKQWCSNTPHCRNVPETIETVAEDSGLFPSLFSDGDLSSTVPSVTAQGWCDNWAVGKMVPAAAPTSW